METRRHLLAVLAVAACLLCIGTPLTTETIRLAPAPVSPAEARMPSGDAAARTACGDDAVRPQPCLKTVQNQQRDAGPPSEPVPPEVPAPFETTLAAAHPSVPPPFALTLAAKRFDPPGPFQATLVVRRPRPPAPFDATLVARRPDPPPPFEVTLSARQPDLPAPFEVTLQGGHPPLPTPFKLSLSASTPLLLPPFAIGLAASRPELPAPSELVLAARRPEVPAPFAMSFATTRSEERQTEVPPVIGLEVTEAVGEVTAANLEAAPALGDPADDRDETPGTVYAVNPSVGTVLPWGSAVTVTVFGPRPKRPVPDIAGLSLDAAIGRISAAGFDPGAPALGDPAGPGDEPGTAQASVPPADVMREIFTVVHPLLFGPRAETDVAAAAGPDPDDLLPTPPDRPPSPALDEDPGSRPPQGEPPAPPGPPPDAGAGDTDDTEAGTDCIPPDQVKSVCLSRDGRDELCRQNNCRMPELTRRVCVSGDGRHDMCRRNGCNPVFTNADGSTFTAPCEWIDEVVQKAVPCYWEARLPPGREICTEETAATAPAPDDTKEDESGWTGRWTFTGTMLPPHSGRMRGQFEVYSERGSLFVSGLEDGRRDGRFPARVSDNTLTFDTPLPNGAVISWTLTRRGDTCSGSMVGRSGQGRLRWRATCSRS